jgi:hypothetical protein
MIIKPSRHVTNPMGSWCLPGNAVSNTSFRPEMVIFLPPLAGISEGLLPPRTISTARYKPLCGFVHRKIPYFWFEKYWSMELKKWN